MLMIMMLMMMTMTLTMSKGGTVGIPGIPTVGIRNFAISHSGNELNLGEMA
jgi:hypothetical protein